MTTSDVTSLRSDFDNLWKAVQDSEGERRKERRSTQLWRRSIALSVLGIVASMAWGASRHAAEIERNSEARVKFEEYISRPQYTEARAHHDISQALGAVMAEIAALKRDISRLEAQK